MQRQGHANPGRADFAVSRQHPTKAVRTWPLARSGRAEIAPYGDFRRPFTVQKKVAPAEEQTRRAERDCARGVIRGPAKAARLPGRTLENYEGTMLLLTRKLGENIRIGDDVKITIVEVKGNHVKLGIDAPPSVKVHREEIYERIQEENRRAQASKPEPPDASWSEPPDASGSEPK